LKTAAPVSTADAAKMLGVSKATLLRWFRQRKIREVGRDRHNWRVFTAADIRRIKREMGIGT
jgi:DNA-binding transcriptional MerR regulator